MMLTFLGTLLATWLSLSLLAYLFSDNANFREVTGSPVIAAFMLMFGWIPSLILCVDVDKRLTTSNTNNTPTK